MDLMVGFTVTISPVSVITLTLSGHLFLFFLHKRGVGPAVATRPFITTSNDIFGIIIFFFIAKLILGF